MQYEQILAETHGRVRLLTLNRPDKLNAWTYRMKQELTHAIEAAGDDDDIGALVVTGAGRGFCAGADIKEAFHARLEGESPQAEGPDRDWVELVRSAKPIVGAINGVAVGVGITMVLPFDVLLASERARIGMFFVKMGLVPELASSHFLVQRVGFAQASEMCLTGQLYDAKDLEGSGLFNRLAPHDELLGQALETAETIAANSTPALAMIKDLLTRNGADSDLEAVQRRELTALAQAYETPEHRAAVEAFLKRAS